VPVTKQEQIYALAEPQHGYFTSAQAKADGLLQNTLTAMARRGVIERVSRGAYRLVNFPLSQQSQYMEAVLWPQAGVMGVISHQSALSFHGLSDVSPAKVHITVSPDHRVRRDLPRHLVLHRARLSEQDVEVLDGIPVTTPARSILDSHAAHLSWALIRQAIEDGRRTGKLLARDATRVEEELGETARRARSPAVVSTRTIP